ncbi:hypothetical protein BC828DRAFT_406472 [Blastocladiella britannica]|nr:hypothetical protein BC828DRAFT_406472 [Blastocladiella britannica]
MAKKFPGENSKGTKNQKPTERKAAVQSEKDSRQRAAKEQREAAEWQVGAKKSSREEEERKKAERLEKKAAAAAALAAEEAAALKSRASAASAARKRDTPRPPGSSVRVTGAAKVAARREEAAEAQATQRPEAVPEYSASGLDAALELLEVAGVVAPAGPAGDDDDVDPSAIAGSSSAGAGPAARQSRAIRDEDRVDRHPERRAKAAWEAYRERELPLLKKESPGLRLSQLNEMLWKRWQKSPENPFNQTAVAYNATADDVRQVVKSKKQEALERMRVK